MTKSKLLSRAALAAAGLAAALRSRERPPRRRHRPNRIRQHRRQEQSRRRRLLSWIAQAILRASKRRPRHCPPSERLHDVGRKRIQGTTRRTAEGRSQTLQQQVAILAPDVRAQKIRAFQAKEAAFKQKVEARQSLIQGGVMKARQQVEAALGPILQGIMQERGANFFSIVPPSCSAWWIST